MLPTPNVPHRSNAKHAHVRVNPDDVQDVPERDLRDVLLCGDHGGLATKLINSEWFVGAVSSAGAFRYLVINDALFASGYE